MSFYFIKPQIVALNYQEMAAERILISVVTYQRHLEQK
jgi:hypothetical protein